ncbi:hypothetical protein Kpol_1014p15 [Vanderwaltozyma polyspora DSM 70294]|uniref:Uncharacterized protein n=1 Tax=Vanderwaltozyma polyspora (strain ATCC 22028 / DSM 70294 / BCRC 21397 / CBS 2163 / NBRC 10782 / NRRL Y-8283 / UCD 57-17) TaxID=436907 RepID=A7TNE4_VANPO|nr:uncharacterized protein Kpol_1014p15 [Vanderwaltozyma polyspora DSM 70294]EDO16197.1 hypothetical protein Kpol_1014p15 [Vanderwaltozyma polyspora DSM 70294]
MFSRFLVRRFASVKEIRVSKVLMNGYSTEAIEARYRVKLEQLAKAKGYASVEEMRDGLKGDIDAKKKEFAQNDPLKGYEETVGVLGQQQQQQQLDSSGLTRSKGPLDSPQPKVPFKTLDSYLNVEKISQLSRQEVEFLWRAKWANKDNVLNAVVPIDVYEKMLANSKENPAFVLPLPREAEGQDSGMELHYIQWQFVGPHTVHCIMTSLAEYKLHKEYARPHTTLQFHSELAKDKNCVFMNGQVETDMNVSLQDAQLLLLNVQRFYGAMGEETPSSKQRLQLLRDFTKGSASFNVDTLITLSQSMEN